MSVEPRTESERIEDRLNSCLKKLFCMPDKRKRFANGLPVAFDMVRKRMPPGNPAVGILREHVIVGFFLAEFGPKNVEIPERGNERGYDVVLCSGEISIKTVTGNQGVKILWTADTAQVQSEISGGYQPEHDILLINIFWGKQKDSAFYIPLSAQKNILKYLGRDQYLSAAPGTNNRGIEIKRKAITALKKHQDTISISVDWNIEDTNYPAPWDEWDEYWRGL